MNSDYDSASRGNAGNMNGPRAGRWRDELIMVVAYCDCTASLGIKGKIQKKKLFFSLAAQCAPAGTEKFDFFNAPKTE